MSIFATVSVSAGDPGPPSDRGVQPVYYDGNPQEGDPSSNCAYFDPTYAEYRLPDLEESGTYSNGHVALDIVVTNDDNLGPYFDWEIAEDSPTKALPGIFVKGGPGGNWYDYSTFEDVPGVEGASWDGFLHSPKGAGPGGSKFYGLSHVSFCYMLPPDAYITIEADDTNEISDPHTFTVTVWEDSVEDGEIGNFVPAAGETVTVTYEALYGADDPADDTCTTDALGQCTVTINSQNAGQIVATATSDVEVDGTIITRTTDGTETPNGGQNSNPAVKTYVDAYIEIAPDDVNLVGVSHAFTVTVWENAGDGAGFVWAEGETVDVTFTSMYGADAQSDASCTTDATGSCTVTVNSDATGQIEATASSYVSVGGLSLYRETDGISPNSGGATKTYVDARISIAEDDDNVVGLMHTFTITLERDLGEGAGWVAFAGQTVTASLSGVGYFVGDDYCVTAADGTCTVDINSDDPSESTVTASFEDEIVAGYADTYISISTDGTGGNSEPAVKTWWVGRINLTPLTATNGITEPHEITAHVEYSDDGTTWQDASGALVTFSLSDGDAYFVDGTDTCTTTDGTCSVWINKPTAGTVTISASSSFTIGGIDGTFSVATGTGYSGPDAEKVYVDAAIAIAPDDVNLVGVSHAFTVTVWEDTGDGSGWMPAEGVTVDVTFESLHGADAQADASCTTGTDGTCTVTVNSDATGQIVATASANVYVGGLWVYRETDGTGGNSGPATKTYVDARISIAEDDDNVVGYGHTFTITLERDLGDGDGFVAFADQIVTANLSGVGYFDGPASCTTAVDGTCTVTINSDEPGQTTVTATFAGEIVTGYADTYTEISTDGTGGNSEPAVKTWWDGRIMLSPLRDTNGITEPHEITATVEYSNDAVTWLPASGALVTFTLALSPTADAYFVDGVDTCTTAVDGTCSVWINKDTGGLVVISASSDFTVSGIDGTFSVSTGTGYSGPDAEKVYVDGTLRWLKYDHMQQLLGGATFEVQRTHDRFGNPVSDAPITVLDNFAPDTDPDAGEFELINLPLGTWTIVETIAPFGFGVDPDTETVILTLENPSNADGDALDYVPVFVDLPAEGQLGTTYSTCEIMRDELLAGDPRYEQTTVTYTDGGGYIKSIQGLTIYWTHFRNLEGRVFDLAVQQDVSSDYGFEKYFGVKTPFAENVKMYDGDCKRLQGDVSNIEGGTVDDPTFSFTFTLNDRLADLSGGPYFMEVKFDHQSLKGQPTPFDPPYQGDVLAHYDFYTLLDGFMVAADSTASHFGGYGGMDLVRRVQ